ncbi:Hypothetical predicted protein, partial [Paramuricea clavata]
MVQSAIGKLEMISRDFPTVLNIATQFAKKAKSKRASFDTDVAVEESLPSEATKRIPKRKLYFCEKDDTRTLDAHEDYQVNVFNVVKDQIVTSTNSRFENQKNFTKIFSCLDPRRFDEFRRQKLPQNALRKTLRKN